MKPIVTKLDAMVIVGCEEILSLESGDFSPIKTAWQNFFSFSKDPCGIVNDVQFWA